MAERLPVGAARNIKSPPLTSLGSNLVSGDLSNASTDKLNGPASGLDLESNGSDNQLLSNGSSTANNHTSGHKQEHPEAAPRIGGRTREGDSRNENEWVEQDEPGVYITLTSLPGGRKDLKRVRFRYVSSSLVCLSCNVWCFFHTVLILTYDMTAPFVATGAVLRPSLIMWGYWGCTKAQPDIRGS